MTESVLARVAAIKAMPTPELKTMWRDLFGGEPPPYNRRFLESRLACRVQELAYGGLKPQTIERLRAIAEDFDGGDSARRQQPAKDRPIIGTRLIREYQGIEHCVTVRDEDFEYQGRPYKSLAAIARTITGTRWNGLIFSGMNNRNRPCGAAERNGLTHLFPLPERPGPLASVIGLFLMDGARLTVVRIPFQNVSSRPRAHCARDSVGA
jgi:Protein of unknown function (DUF2924)